MIELDVETTGLQWYSPNQRAFLYQFHDGQSTEVIRPDDEAGRNRIQAWLDRGAIEGVRAWNSKFDLHFAESAGFTLPPQAQWHDGMLEAHAIDERRSVALKNVAKGLFGEDADDLQQEVKAWLTAERRRRKTVAREAGEELVEPNYEDVPDDLMERYGAEDVLLTRKVCDAYAPAIAKSSDLSDIVEFERQVLGGVYSMERRGMPVSESDYHSLETELIENLESLEERAENLAKEGIDAEALEDFDFNPKSSAQIHEALERRGADLRFVTNGSMDVDNLTTIDDPLAHAILAFRAEYKALSTYVRPMLGRSYVPAMRHWKEPFIAPGGRVHANYRQVGARTGRFSASDPNIQNQPRDDLRLRYCFRAEPGMKLVTCDLSNIEMRVFAAYTGEGRLLDTIREGRDVYEDVAANIGIADRVRAGGHVETARQRAKMFSLSIIYGAGLRSIRKQLRCDMNQAKLMQRRYYDAYPEVGRLQNRIIYKLQDQGYIRSAWGRRFRSDRPDREGYKFTNYLVQGTAADLLKAAIIRLHGEGLPLVAAVHDELICHVPTEDAAEAQVAMERALIEHPRITEKVPLTADGVIVDRWSDAKPLKDGSLFVPEFAR